MIPSVEKCISFLGLNQQGLETPEKLREWISSHKQDSYQGPASTAIGTGQVVPFYTPSATSCPSKFKQGYLFLDTGSSFDEVLGMKLFHGFVCSGGWGNNSYHTFLASDKKGSSDRIRSGNLGAKFYFLTDKENSNSDYRVLNPGLVIVVLNIRIEDGEITCLPLQIRTNSSGFRGLENHSDRSFRKFTQREGWDTRRVWDIDSFNNATDKDLEQKIHGQIIERIKSVLC